MDLDNEELEATKKLQEKTADEMFKELGYEIEKIGNGTEYYLDDIEEIDILVNVDSKKPEIWINDDFHAITMEELKAIYKKCKEEGYI